MEIVRNIFVFVIAIHNADEFVAELDLAGTVFLLLQGNRIVAKFPAKVAFDAQQF